jgi:hypothetical protein
MSRRFVTSVLLTGLFLASAAGRASASPPASSTPVSPIAPKQTFAGLVNGASGSAVIRMGCFGPVRPYQLGHPLAGQSLAVTRLVPTSAALAALGFTGEASSIAAYADFPSPLASPVRPQLALFQYYNLPAQLSTDVLLPCGGSGQIVFEPVDGGTTARAAVVKVSFLGQP